MNQTRVSPTLTKQVYLQHEPNKVIPNMNPTRLSPTLTKQVYPQHEPNKCITNINETNVSQHEAKLEYQMTLSFAYIEYLSWVLTLN